MHWLPHLNAFLNGLSAVLLLSGYRAIRRGRVELHKRCMLAAFASSIVFLVSYLANRYIRGELTRYQGGTLAKTIYLSILFSHTVLAALVPFLAITVIVLAWRGKIEKHKRLARWTLPIWLYVSVTGVVVYLMLYQF